MNLKPPKNFQNTEKNNHSFMKINSAKLYSFPVRGRTEWLILEICSDSNYKGFSELTMSNYRKNNQLKVALVEGLNKLSKKEIYNDIQISDLININEATNDLALATSISGIRSACSDIFAQESSKSLKEYLRNLFSLKGFSSNTIKLYANINRSLLPNDNGPVDRSTAAFVKMAKKAISDGFSYIKCAPFDNYPDDFYTSNKFINAGLARIDAIANILNNEQKLFVDCHSKFDINTSIEVEQKLFALGVAWFEEPMNPKKFSKELKSIKKLINGNLVGGEEFFGAKKFLETLNSKTLDILMPDVKYCGGLVEATKIGIELAKKSQNSFSIHCPSGPISLLGSSHVTAALNSKLPMEHAVYEIDDRYSYIFPEEAISNGEFNFPTGPGLGAKPNFKKSHKTLLDINY